MQLMSIMTKPTTGFDEKINTTWSRYAIRALLKCSKSNPTCLHAKKKTIKRSIGKNKFHVMLRKICTLCGFESGSHESRVSRINSRAKAISISQWSASEAWTLLESWSFWPAWISPILLSYSFGSYHIDDNFQNYMIIWKVTLIL